jgi:transcriptional regulator with XRE-family HTH domain
MAKASTEKSEYAKVLFLRENLTQEEIADKVGVSRQTINRWVQKGNWEQLKASLTVTRDEQLERLYLQVAEINSVISRREDRRYATIEEAKILNNLADAIDKMERELGLSDVFNVSRNFLNWIRKADVDRAKEMSGLFDCYIKELSTAKKDATRR